MPASPSPFALPDRLAAKRDPALIGADERHFARLAAHLEESAARLERRQDEALRLPARSGEAAWARDEEVRRIGAELAVLRRYGLDLCLGRMLPADGGAPVYVGRVGLTDAEGERLLVDWRSPAAEPFFAATHADPRGLASRRRYRWARGRITDYWDEVFGPDAVGNPALDDQSAFLASLAASRSPRMRDVLGTIQADQDAIIRAASGGALVIDGGPGTGKTVVALHRAAYLLYADPRVGPRHGGVLVIGPSHAYLDYVADVLPSLGEEGVRIATLRDLVPEGALASAEDDPAVARLKSGTVLLDALEEAVRRYEQPPARGLLVATPWGDARITPDDWADAFDSAERGATHNEARAQVWEELTGIVAGQLDPDLPASELERALRGSELRRAFGRAWPLLDPVGVVADLLSVPAYLRQCAPGLSTTEVAALRRPDPRAWTLADLPLLDAARHRIGDPDLERVAARRRAELAHQRAGMDRVVDELVAGDDSELLLSHLLRVEDARRSLVDESALTASARDELAGPFAHVVVDEAQELTDAEWRMVLRRVPSGSLTIVGDRAQARRGFAESWSDRLRRVGIDDVRLAGLTINYRTPEEIMAEAAPVIRAALPDANVPTSVRRAGIPVHSGSTDELDDELDAWLAANAEGTACVIGGSTAPRDRVVQLDPVAAKGLEFDLVILVDPERLGEGVTGAVDRYVAMTRATQRLVILRSGRPARRAT